ncbi:FdtA/QdtA family cupin domain-containing protein [Geobacter sp. SVR]|uniref:sugar 3,4-ketoisomerase n=1 Tax=Geobacter sp. SVR TaxID=2495594 RepID=UPI00143EF711|nr:FdtA/QdtA family cupin domain-containing protein [Geobacter sp. SVR]BCS55005.1 hypothetical protein GSVR_33130 [Geobacter sp. SVR]GCF85187.1 hypothetical protein GSbR_17870 [Geobacter sp. SVR]
MPLSDCKIIDLPKIADPRGNLTFVEGTNHIPFDIKRVFYLYDVPGGEMRAGHSNIYSEQFIIAMSGSFDVIVDDGFDKKTFHLNRAYYGLYLPTNVWREIDNFSSGAVCLVLTSTTYSADDYIREYETFLEAAKKK